MNISNKKMTNNVIGANIAHLWGKKRETLSSKLASLLKLKAIPRRSMIKINLRIALATILLMV